MMYPIEMQAISMAGESHSEMAATIERTGQRMSEIQLKKQAFADQYQRTLQIQEAERNKMALQQLQIQQEQQKIALGFQKHQFEQQTQSKREFQSILGTVSRDEDGNIRVAHRGISEGGGDAIDYETFQKDDPDLQRKVARARGYYQAAPSQMDQLTREMRESSLSRQQQVQRESRIRLSENKLAKATKKLEGLKDEFSKLIPDQSLLGEWMPSLDMNREELGEWIDSEGSNFNITTPKLRDHVIRLWEKIQKARAAVSEDELRYENLLRYELPERGR
tara:strand:+ start:724 stop:1557 length:834 start_codon:yes stop_codon:yes gene_type:complete